MNWDLSSNFALTCYHTTGKELFPPMERFMKLREDQEAFCLFMTHVVSHVHGRVDFKARSVYLPVRKLVSVSSEAFALFVLDGNYDRWVHEFETKDVGQAPDAKHTNKGAARKDEGYKIESFKVLLDLGVAVLKDRKMGHVGEVEENYMVVAKGIFENEKSKKRRKRMEDRGREGNTMAEMIKKLKAQSEGIYDLDEPAISGNRGSSPGVQGFRLTRARIMEEADRTTTPV